MRKNSALKLLLLYFINSCMSAVYCQARYTIESEVVGGQGQNTPFWMMSNKHGISSTKLNNGYVRMGIFHETNLASNFQFRYGLDLIKTANYISNVIVQQAYLEILLNKKFALSIGSKEMSSLFKNNNLSSGGMSWSGNARPIPMISFSTNDFISLPWLLNNNFKIKAATSFGWFTDASFQKDRVIFDPLVLNSSFYNFYNGDVRYHQKELFLKYKNPKTAWSFTLGLELHMQFSGDKYYYKEGHIEHIHTPADIKHYLLAFIPSQGDKSSPTGDQQYIFGNTLGSEHIVLEYIKPHYILKGYLENFFEDFGGMSKQNGFDGLWGLECNIHNNYGLTGILLEYVQTTNQGSAIHWAPNDFKNTKLLTPATGNDDYYNNGMYTGWEHWGMTNGNPLVSSPIYNIDGSMRIENNRVKSYHFGISGRYDKTLNCRFLATYSDGWGRHYQPFLQLKSNLSTLLEINYKPKANQDWVFSISTAIDRGNLYGNNEALSIKISKK